MAKRRGRERSITLEEFQPRVPVAPPGVDFHLVEVKGDTTRTITRRGKWRYNEVVTRHRTDRSRSFSRAIVRERATIKFGKIVAAFKVDVEPDDRGRGAPWQEYDGWEHVLITSTQFVNGFADDPDFQEVIDDFMACRGHVAGKGNIDLNLLNDNCKGNYDAIYSQARHLGASKQVARELQAAWRRKYIKQLVEWYKDGYYWYRVYGQFRGREEHVGGIDDRAYAENELVHELAEQLAYDLKKRGFLIDYGGAYGRKRALYKREQQIARLKANLNSQCWDG